MIKNKKTIIILVSFLVIFYIIVCAVISFPKGKKYKNTVFIGSNTKITLNNGIINTYNENRDIARQKVKIYFRKKFVDGYIVSKSTDTSNSEKVCNVYDEEGNELYPESSIIAHTPDISISIKESNSIDSENINEINDYIKANNIVLSESTNLDYLKITNFDYNNDGTSEYVYSVGLYNDNTYTSFVYLKLNDKIILIDSIDDDDNQDNQRLYFSNLIDLNNDGKYEFVVEKMMSEYGPTYYELYNFDGNKFTKLGGE